MFRPGAQGHSSVRFFHEPDTESWKELKSLPPYCMECNPHFFETELKLLEGTDSYLGRRASL
jgi:hypothetical protein